MKKLILITGLSLSLASCGGDKTPQAVTANSISGTVVEQLASDGLNLKTTPWTGGAGRIIVNNTTDNTQLTSGTLNADGTFTVALPTPTTGLQKTALGTPEDFAPIEGMTCTGKPTFSTTDFQGTSARLSVDANKDGEVNNFLATGSQSDTSLISNVKVGSLFYVDRAVQISGGQTCTASEEGLTYSISINFKANLQAGWNLLTLTQEFNAVKTGEQTGTLSIAMTFSSGGLPTNQWVLGNVMTPLSLKSSFAPLR